MFGLSLTKLLLTAALVLILWYGFRALGRLDRERRAELRHRAGGARGKPAAGPEVEDMVRCPRCGTYVSARDPRACGLDGCPYP